MAIIAANTGILRGKEEAEDTPSKSFLLGIDSQTLKHHKTLYLNVLQFAIRQSLCMYCHLVNSICISAVRRISRQEDV
jgi:hypothetical protein